MEALRAAPLLEFLCIGGLSSPSAAHVSRAEGAAFWDWVAQHPPLRRLGLETKPSLSELESLLAPPPHPDLLNEVLILWRRRPTLSVFQTGNRGLLGQRDALPSFAETASAD